MLVFIFIRLMANHLTVKWNEMRFNFLKGNSHTEKAKKRNCLCISHKSRSKSHIAFGKFWPFLKSNLCTRSAEKKTSKNAWVCVCNKVSSFCVSLSLFLFLYWLIKHYFSSVGGDNTHFLRVKYFHLMWSADRRMRKKCAPPRSVASHHTPTR